MPCHDEDGKRLGSINCFPNVGEQHMWGEYLYECIGDNGKGDCDFAYVFKKILPNPANAG